MGVKQPRSTVLTTPEEAIIVAFRKHTLLSLDDCLYALQENIPHLNALCYISVLLLRKSCPAGIRPSCRYMLLSKARY